MVEFLVHFWVECFSFHKFQIIFFGLTIFTENCLIFMSTYHFFKNRWIKSMHLFFSSSLWITNTEMPRYENFGENLDVGTENRKFVHKTQWGPISSKVHLMTICHNTERVRFGAGSRWKYLIFLKNLQSIEILLIFYFGS